VNELKGEKVDIVEWDENTPAFIAEALSPARVIEVRLDEEEQTAIVIVPDHQLSLAIGKEGQNARLAARLSGYRIDIQSESQGLGLEPEDEEADDGQPTTDQTATDDGQPTTDDRIEVDVVEEVEEADVAADSGELTAESASEEITQDDDDAAEDAAKSEEEE
jgi:N utilization substance protein A